MKYRVLLVGLSGAGKTHLVGKLEGNSTEPQPTKGIIEQDIKYKNVTFTFIDVSGKARLMWHNATPTVDLVAYVIDTADRDRVPTAIASLKEILQDSDLDGIPLLIYANKQDIQSGFSVNQIREQLTKAEFPSANDKRQWYLQPCDGIRGDGLYEGLEWASQHLPKAPRHVSKAKRIDIRGLMVGFDGAGKTTLLYHTKEELAGGFESFVFGKDYEKALKSPEPTDGFLVETVIYKHVNCTIWDVGGSQKMRPLWRHYYKDEDLVIYLIAMNDTAERIDASLDSLATLLGEDDLQGLPVLVLGSKADLAAAGKADELRKRVEKVVTSAPSVAGHPPRIWRFQTLSTKTGEGVSAAFNWINATVPPFVEKKRGCTVC